jgi:hypothetical protein
MIEEWGRSEIDLGQLTGGAVGRAPPGTPNPMFRLNKMR